MPSRRSAIAFTPEEQDQFLKDGWTIQIASIGPKGYPHLVAMWYVLIDGEVHFTTFAKSQKVLNYQRDPRATLLVESGTEYAELKGVVIYARCEIVPGLDDVVDTLVKINTRGRAVDEGQRQALIGAVSKTASKRVALKFHPERYVSWDHAKLGGRY